MSKSLGVAFGGSGAEGIAGIAYIRAMEELGVEPSIVSGTGIGGAVAAMYAAGMKSSDMISFLDQVNFPGAKRPINENKVKDSRYGILDDIGLEDFFQIVMPVKVFDRLYFPLKIVAADYISGSEVVFSEGDVGSAVRSAVSVPGIFSPRETENSYYIDGTSVNPVPFDIIRNDCDVLVAVDPYIEHAVEEEGEQAEVSLSVYPVFKGAYNAAKRALIKEKLIKCRVDIHETVGVNILNTYDFVQYAFILDELRERTESFKAKLSSLLE